MEAELALKAATTVAPNTGSSSCLNHQALLQEGKRQSPTRELEGAQRGNAAPALGFQLSSAIPNSVLSPEGSRCTLRSCLCSARLSALLGNKPQQGQRLFSAADSCFPSIPSSWHHSCIWNAQQWARAPSSLFPPNSNSSFKTISIQLF